MIIIFYYYISLAIDFWYKSKVPYSIQFFFINETNSLTIMWHLSREVLPNIVWALCCNLPTSHLNGVDWLLFWPMKRFCKFFYFYYYYFFMYSSCFFAREVFDEMIRRPWPALFVRYGSHLLPQPFII